MTSYSDYEENRGAGMFPTKQAIEGGREAYTIALNFLDGDTNDVVTVNDSAVESDEFIVIAHEYWNDLDFDNRNTYSQTNHIIENVKVQIVEFMASLEKIQPNVRRALSSLAEPYRTDIYQPSKDIVEAAIAANGALKRAIDQANANVNERRPKTAVKNACAKLMELRLRLVGRKLDSNTVRVKAADRDLKSGYAEEFRGRDAQFVYLVLRTIDPKVSIKTVGTSFDEHVTKMRGK